MCFIVKENLVREICRPPPVVQASIPRIYDVVNDQLVLVVAWAGLYMYLGVGLNARYVIMCRKAVLISEYDEELTYSGLWQHSLSIVISLAERAKRWCTVLFKFVNTLVSSNFSTVLPIACVVGRKNCFLNIFWQMSNFSSKLLKTRWPFFRFDVWPRIRTRTSHLISQRTTY